MDRRVRLVADLAAAGQIERFAGGAHPLSAVRPSVRPAPTEPSCFISSARCWGRFSMVKTLDPGPVVLESQHDSQCIASNYINRVGTNSGRVPQSPVVGHGFLPCYL